MDEKLKALFAAICEQEKDAAEANEVIDFVISRLDTFPAYFDAVYKDVLSLESDTMLRNSGLIDQEQFAFRRESIDATRKMKHDVAISACNQINRQCDAYGVPHICPDIDMDHLDRTMVADFIGTFVYNTYEQGIGQVSMDKAIDVARENHVSPDHGYGSLESRFKEAVKIANDSKPGQNKENAKGVNHEAETPLR